MSVSEFMKKLNQNKFFKFISSVRLAVPLMLILGGLVAYGTVVEADYNAEYAAMAIYKTGWFGALLILLWINIFAATISRIPFKQHHTGFVITHIGLLLLLIGGYVTNSDGIDGQLVVPEGQASSTVVLPHLMVGYQFEGAPTPQVIKFKKSVSAKEQNQLNDINDVAGHLFTVKKYIPFAKIEKQYIESSKPSDQSVALSFILKSSFFNVNEWLHTENNPSMKLGPATLKIVKTDDINQAPAIKKSNTLSTKKEKRMVNSVQSSSQGTDSYLILTSIKDSSQTKKIKLSDLQKKTVSAFGFQIKLVKFYQRAMVSSNKVMESEDPTHNNPAVELSIEKDGQKLREVLYAKFAGFSLNQNGVYGYKLAFESSGTPSVPSSPHGGSSAETNSNKNEESVSANDPVDLTPAQQAMKGDNTIIFSVDPKVKNKARVTLTKNNQVVMSEIVSEGQNIQTPWMGMTIFLGSVRQQAVEQVVAQPINAEKAPQLPPSALLIETTENPKEEFWLAEGEQKLIRIAGKNASVYFGRQTIELPFDIKLNKFTKVDYPGTNTPMSFESLVEIAQTGIKQKISMNEPMKLEGFTIYQASYSIEPGQTLSIFSVNRDPGRATKYIGSLILGLGIILITLMRSRFWKNLTQRKAS